MKKLTVVFTALLLWSTTSFASFSPASAESDLQTISQWTQHLNKNFQMLNLKANTSNPKKYGAVLGELDQLEQHLHGDIVVPDGSLIQLACDICVCVGCKGSAK